MWVIYVVLTTMLYVLHCDVLQTILEKTQKEARVNICKIINWQVNNEFFRFLSQVLDQGITIIYS